MVYLTRKEHFNAAHRLYNDAWSAEKNFEVFGKCANPNFHGHNYNLFVTVKGNPSTSTGFIMDAKKLSEIIHTEVIELLDHKNLSLEVPGLAGILPSTENVAVFIWNKLLPHINDCTLHCVKLQETETIFAEYYGE